MCGRFTRYLSWSEIHRLYRLTAQADAGRNTEPRYNIAPTEDVLFVTAGDDGNHKLREGRWWLVPWWAKDMPKAATFNARVETADTSGAFKDAFKSKRCLIPADGFYEWTKRPADGGKDPWHIFLPGPAPFSFAGLWAHNDKLGITSCTIITMPAAQPMRHCTTANPPFLSRPSDAWLDPATPEPKALLDRNLDGDLQFRRVGRAVNSTKDRSDAARMIEPMSSL